MKVWTMMCPSIKMDYVQVRCQFMVTFGDVILLMAEILHQFIGSLSHYL